MFSFYVKPNQVISIRPAHDTRVDTYPGKELSVPYNAECWCLQRLPQWRQWARVPALSAFEVDGWVSDGLFSPDTGGLPLKAAALNVQRSRKKGEEWFSDRATLMNGPVTLATVARRNCPCIQGVNKFSLWFLLHYSEKVPTSAFSFLKAYRL